MGTSRGVSGLKHTSRVHSVGLIGVTAGRELNEPTGGAALSRASMTGEPGELSLGSGCPSLTSSAMTRPVVARTTAGTLSMRCARGAAQALSLFGYV